MLPPALGAAAISDLVQAASQLLEPSFLQIFLAYAESLNGAVRTILPPVRLPEWQPPPAEVLAHHFLSQGEGSIWSATRQVISLLDFTAARHGKLRHDPRARNFTIGAYSKTSFIGLTRETLQFPNVARGC